MILALAVELGPGINDMPEPLKLSVTRGRTETEILVGSGSGPLVEVTDPLKAWDNSTRTHSILHAVGASS